MSFRKAKHEPIISLATFNRIQERLNEGVYAPARKDISESFPLRGAVCCSACNKPLTAGWCKGKYKKYPYYFCQQKGCELKGKTISRDKLESRFSAFLHQLRPSDLLFNIASTMFADLWEQQANKAAERAAARRKRVKQIDGDIDNLVERIIDAQNARVISGYEGRIEKLEREKYALLELSGAESAHKTMGYRELFELSMRFLSSPWKLWDSGNITLQRLVLKLGFSAPITYCRKTGELNTKTSLPFRVLEQFSSLGNEMVLLGRIELPTSSLPMTRSTTELQQPSLPGVPDRRALWYGRLPMSSTACTSPVPPP